MFPDVIVECAFNNDYDDYSNAQTGYTDITPFVKNISGDLRGRKYEIGRAEAGTISIDLDNADGRFTPGRPASPYYPNVKSNRRLRIRGKNMLPPNVASSGEQEHDATGFFKSSDSFFTGYVTEDPIALEGALEVIVGGGKWSIYSRVNSGCPPTYQRPVEWYAPIELGVRLVHSVYVWGNTTAVSNVGHSARFEIHYFDSDNQEITTTAIAPKAQFTVPASATRYQFSHVPPAEAKYAICTIAYLPGTTLTADALIVIANPQTELPLNLAPNPSGYHDVLGWNVEGAADSAITQPTVITSNVLLDGVGTRAHTAVTTAANDWIVVQTIMENNGSDYSNMAPTTSTLTYDTLIDSGPSPLFDRQRVFTWVEQDTVGGSRTVTMNPQEPTLHYSSRITVIRNSSGPGTYSWARAQSIFLQMAQNNSILLGALGAMWASDQGTRTWTPSGLVTIGTPEFITSHAAYDFNRLDNTGSNANPATFGLVSPAWTNPTIAFVEMKGLISGSSSTTAQQDSTNQAIRIDWNTVNLADDNARAGIEIPHLIPGETYSLILESKKLGTPNYFMSMNEGQTGVTISNTSFTSYSMTFVADRSEQTLSFFALSNTTIGDKIWFRRLNIVKGSTVPALSPLYGDIQDATAWEFPKPIFEGWTEKWPARVGPSSTEVVVSVVDRLKRIGTIELSNVLGEMLFLDAMELIVPFTDSPTDSQGYVSQVGGWADSANLTQLKLQASKGDIAGSNYVLGVDGPTDETAIQFNQQSPSLGYSLPVPYSADSIVIAAPTPTPAPGGYNTKPPVYSATTYTRVYYATWSRTYDSAGATTWDDSPYAYQGYYSDDRGNNRSLIGFNYSQIKADLAGATVRSVKLTMQNAHWYYNAGGIALIGTHIYATKPSTWNTSNVTENRISSNAWPKDGRAAAELGVTIGNEFKAGIIKGISLGPGLTTSLNYYGYFNGATQSNRPSLTITFVK